jgi:hypothetical protein
MVFRKARGRQITDCKIVSSIHRVCKQTQPVQLKHLDVECEPQMLVPIQSIPTSCSRDLENSTTQFGHSLTTMNEWIYAAPLS